jgi:hypothetical protein
MRFFPQANYEATENMFCTSIYMFFPQTFNFEEGAAGAGGRPRGTTTHAAGLKEEGARDARREEYKNKKERGGL